MLLDQTPEITTPNTRRDDSESMLGHVLLAATKNCDDGRRNTREIIRCSVLLQLLISFVFFLCCSWLLTASRNSSRVRWWSCPPLAWAVRLRHLSVKKHSRRERVQNGVTKPHWDYPLPISASRHKRAIIQSPRRTMRYGPTTVNGAHLSPFFSR